jgi:serine/threonine protein kinase
MPLHVGDKLGPYEIISPIGEGGMGEVWKARDSRLDRTVAITSIKESGHETMQLKVIKAETTGQEKPGR